LIAEVERFFASIALEECVARFVPADCCFSPVLTLAEGIESEQCRARGLVRRAPSGALQALFPARVDGEPPESRPPLRGTRGGFGEPVDKAG
jgi:crotonobetainyl-CoA:carnitine CoA-transferase CaiB-like acyl-CoA transferase